MFLIKNSRYFLIYVALFFIINIFIFTTIILIKKRERQHNLDKLKERDDYMTKTSKQQQKQHKTKRELPVIKYDLNQNEQILLVINKTNQHSTNEFILKKIFHAKKLENFRIKKNDCEIFINESDEKKECLKMKSHSHSTRKPLLGELDSTLKLKILSIKSSCPSYFLFQNSSILISMLVCNNGATQTTGSVHLENIFSENINLTLTKVRYYGDGKWDCINGCSSIQPILPDKCLNLLIKFDFYCNGENCLFREMFRIKDSAGIDSSNHNIITTDCSKINMKKSPLYINFTIPNFVCPQFFTIPHTKQININMCNELEQPITGIFSFSYDLFTSSKNLSVSNSIWFNDPLFNCSVNSCTSISPITLEPHTCTNTNSVLIILTLNQSDSLFSLSVEGSITNTEKDHAYMILTEPEIASLTCKALNYP